MNNFIKLFFAILVLSGQTVFAVETCPSLPMPGYAACLQGKWQFVISQLPVNWKVQSQYIEGDTCSREGYREMLRFTSARYLTDKQNLICSYQAEIPSVAGGGMSISSLEISSSDYVNDDAGSNWDIYNNIIACPKSAGSAFPTITLCPIKHK